MAKTPPAPEPAPDPKIEIGHSNASLAPWSAFYDATEDVSELRFPTSVKVYDKMRNDDQLSALLLSFTLPIHGYRWYIEPNGARDEVVEHVANDFGLPIEGQDPQPQGRLRDRFSHDDYMRHALLKLVYGFMMFEQVYRLGDDDKLHVRMQLAGIRSRASLVPPTTSYGAQRAQHERTAVARRAADVQAYDLVRHGRAPEALQDLNERGRVHVAATDADRMAAMQAKYRTMSP